MPEPLPFISVIIPVRNEEKVLDHCLRSLLELDYPKDKYEIIVVDGLSTDHSKSIAKKYPIKLISNTKQTAPSGRNLGFAQTNGDLIAFSDADCTFDKNWLKNCVKYFSDTSIAGIGGVTLLPPDSSNFERTVNLVFELAGTANATAHLQKSPQMKFVDDLPGCNAIYVKEILEKVMPINEDIVAAEDVLVNFQLRDLGYRLLAAPDLVVWHYRRNSPSQFARQTYWYATARLQATKKCGFKLIKYSHVMTALFFPALLFGCIVLKLPFVISFFSFLLLLSIAALIKTKKLAVALYTPLVLTIFFFTWSIGFFRELIFPMKNFQRFKSK